MHRFVWPLRYPAPAELANGNPFADGVWAAPGSYTVTLEAAGERLSQPLEVAPDPRLGLPQEAYDAQLTLAREVEDLRARVAGAVDRSDDELVGSAVRELSQILSITGPPELARVYPALAGGRQKVEVAYRTALGEATEPAALLEALERRRADELRRRITLVGPHRDDLAIELDGVDARAFGSRGQQRLLALALRLAEVLPVTEAAGTAPVLLLDDALSELDPLVRDNVVREIQAAEQVFLTSPDDVVVSGAARWIVESGGIAAA